MEDERTRSGKVRETGAKLACTVSVRGRVGFAAVDDEAAVIADGVNGVLLTGDQRHGSASMRASGLDTMSEVFGV